MEPPKLETSVADAVGEMAPRFFNLQQFAALQKLGDILMPPLNGAPGSSEAHAAEFLDFLIGESPADRQQLYRAGLDALNTAAHSRFNKPFAETDASQAAELLSPLRAPWTFDPPADPLARFLREAKADVRTATLNSREYVAAGSSSGRRGFGGQGLYWYPLD
jgi:Gluconate 2-dehydrogenase subunit 3